MPGKSILDLAGDAQSRPAKLVSILVKNSPCCYLFHMQKLLDDLARQYPSSLIDSQLEDIRREAFHVSLVKDRISKGGHVGDFGGGLGLFSVACAAVGLDSTLVDDFDNPVNAAWPKDGLPIHHKYGVTVRNCSVFTDGLAFPPESFDIVTSFDSMEHWHHSPKRFFRRVVTWLKPGGFFIMGVPNCVNLRKRLTVPLGRGKWSTMADWYEQDCFRGHVREPDVADLHYIARDMNMVKTHIVGRNWLGYRLRTPVVRFLMPLIDQCLRPWPSLCSDLYLIAEKPQSPS